MLKKTKNFNRRVPTKKLYVICDKFAESALKNIREIRG